MSDFDQRQYGLMLRSLDDFASGRMRLDTLISNLEGLLNAVGDVGDDWKQSFLHFWGQLEDERAVALFRNQTSLDEEAMQRVSAATVRLREMILEKARDTN